MAKSKAKNIDQKQFENLCSLQCTLMEVCAWFDVDDCTLNKWCKKTYKKTFSEVFKEKRGKGLISLRRAQFQLAQKNASMAIFLGKNYLGQVDVPQIENKVTVNNSGLVEALKETTKEVWKDGE
jgi:hypothetical protein